MSEILESRRKRLKFRSWHRGTKEADLLLGRFADRHLPDFDAAALDDYEAILDLPDPDLVNWISGRAEPPAEVRTPVMELILSFDFVTANLDALR